MSQKSHFVVQTHLTSKKRPFRSMQCRISRVRVGLGSALAGTSSPSPCSAVKGLPLWPGHPSYRRPSIVLRTPVWMPEWRPGRLGFACDSS